MKNYLLALCLFIPLSACQTDGSVGRGPLKLAPEVQAHLDDYMEKSSPAVFVVSTDGNVGAGYYCPDVFDGCMPSNHTFRAIKDCQEVSEGVPCKIYAKGRRVVWENTSD